MTPADDSAALAVLDSMRAVDVHHSTSRRPLPLAQTSSLPKLKHAQTMSVKA